MPRENQIEVTTGGVRREYHLIYEDDSPERTEAVKFFQEHTECLFPSMNYPEEVANMPIEAANAYLREHPFQEQWSLLRIGHQNPISDDDLARLRYLPELDHVQISSDRITDTGIEHLVHLPALTRLGVYSASVTNACLRIIRTLRSLQSLDIQVSPNVSRAAVLAAVDAMPWLRDAYPVRQSANQWEPRERGAANEGETLVDLQRTARSPRIPRQN
ncbi:MAG: hypothetical protein C0467_31650 [Planctomycetaceae bacterium]|nr:hypothetical protein [Planctomycetaceae bacterium]